MKLLQRKMTMAWTKWRSEAQKLAAERYAVAGTITRMLKRQLSMAFEKWQAEAASLAKEKYALSGAITRILDKTSFKLCGFADEERMFGLSSSEHLGTSVLQDFFAFPEKFMFFEIDGLSALNLLDFEVDGVIQLHINLVLGELIPKSIELSANCLKLNCVPLINLFDKMSVNLHEY